MHEKKRRLEWWWGVGWWWDGCWGWWSMQPKSVGVAENKWSRVSNWRNIQGALHPPPPLLLVSVGCCGSFVRSLFDLKQDWQTQRKTRWREGRVTREFWDPPPDGIRWLRTERREMLWDEMTPSVCSLFCLLSFSSHFFLSLSLSLLTTGTETLSMHSSSSSFPAQNLLSDNDEDEEDGVDAEREGNWIRDKQKMMMMGMLMIRSSRRLSQERKALLMNLFSVVLKTMMSL